MFKMFDISEREVKKMKKIVQKINNFEPEIQKLTDEEMGNKTEEFKKRYQEGESLDSILPEAFALVREASVRTLGMRHYDVQMMGGITLHRGNISEMRTGEGKTLVSTLPVYLNALTGKGVHVVTVNEYLAQRDAEEMGVIHNFLGLTVGINLNNMTHFEKKEAYNCDIIYGTNNEFGFDYLKDNMVLHKEEKVQRGLSFAIIDEVDSVLIDEARTPLIISGKADKPTSMYTRADAVVKMMKQDVHYKYDEKTKTVSLSEDGITKVESAYKIENLFDISNVEINHHINQALKAHVVMKNDIDYVVAEGKVLIVDQFTGRIMDGRRFSDGLHQAIEAKEGVRIENESMTLATITFQNYFRMYDKLSGMTGTAKTEKEEFREIYKMDVITIPTNLPIQRIDKVDSIYKSEEEKYQAIVERVKEAYSRQQPVLVGTANIETSELLSEKFKKAKIPHHVLNAKNHEKEADIISQAGQKGAITIATNMAGRGTDIKLGEGVQDLGGLMVIGSERHESRRIDNQLRGRSGRQGDPGMSVFYISLEDELMRRFGRDNIKDIMERLGIPDGEAIESRMVSKAIESAQKRVEGNNFDSRKWVLKYDDVLREQREIIYKQREQILEEDSQRDLVLSMVENTVERSLEHFVDDDEDEEERNYDAFLNYLNTRIFGEDGVKKEDLFGRDLKEITEILLDKVNKKYAEKEKELGEGIREFERAMLLRSIDSRWIEHIDAMTQLRQGISLRSYGQVDPLREYQIEGFEMFERMMGAIEEEVATFVMKAQVHIEVKVEEKPEQKEITKTNVIEIKKAKKKKVKTKK